MHRRFPSEEGRKEDERPDIGKGRDKEGETKHPRGEEGRRGADATFVGSTVPSIRT